MRWSPNTYTRVEIKCRRCKTLVEIRYGQVTFTGREVDSLANVV